MAVAVVRSKQTAGAAASTLAITAPSAGNTLALFILQEFGVGEAPSGKDNISLSVGWNTNATSAIFAGSTISVWLALKKGLGTETTLSAVPGTAGTIIGLSYFELSGASTEIEALVHTDNSATSTSQVSAALTTTTAGDAVLGCVGFGASNGGSGSWTGTGPMTRVEEGATRCMGGSYVPVSTLSAATFTANWTTSRQHGMLVAAIKPSVTELIGKGAGSLSAGANTSATSNRRTQASASVSVGPRLSATTAKIAAAQGEVHAGLRMSATAESVRPSAGALHLGARISTSASKLAQAGGEVSAGPRISATAAKLAQGAGSASVGARLSSSASKLAAGSANVSVGVRLSSGSLKIGQAMVEVHVGPRIAGVAAGRTGSGQGQLHLGVGLQATAQKVASATGQLSAGVRLVPTFGSRRTASGLLHLGARTSSTAGKRVQGAGALTLGARLSSAYATTRSSTSQLHAGVRLAGEGHLSQRIGALRVGAQIQGTGEAVIIPLQPPAATPFAPVVSVGRTGRLGNATGRVAANETGRPNR